MQLSTGAEPLLAVRDLTVTYDLGRRANPVRALTGVDLEINTGETVGLVGESGSGKSTLGHAILGMVEADRGQIWYDGVDIAHCSATRRRELTREIQAVFQDPFGSLNPARTISQTLEEGLLAHTKLTKAQRRERVEEALTRVGLSASAAYSFPAQFSGGQRQRIAIARALILSPRLIVCDEAVSALDLSIQAQILNLLRSLQAELKLTTLFITHDMAVVRHVADRVVVLHHGEVVEAGLSEQVCERPVHPYTRRLVASAPTPDPVAQRQRRALVSQGADADARSPLSESSRS